jgi:hypothetical protein
VEQAAWAEAMAARMDQAGIWADHYDAAADSDFVQVRAPLYAHACECLSVYARAVV